MTHIVQSRLGKVLGARAHAQEDFFMQQLGIVLHTHIYIYIYIQLPSPQ